MNYVVVDFEWNQSSYGKGSENKKMPFEIIEIGAVLLDEDLNEIDRFSRTVKPKVYKKLHYITKELTGITQEELMESDPFPYVLVDFMLWCGDDFTFCVWGNTDLIELQRNMKYYQLQDLLPGPIRYYNIQKMFKKFYKEETNVLALEAAIDYLRLPKQEIFHRALNDALYTADIFRQFDLEEADKIYSVDYYQNPQSKDEEIHLIYEDYYKFISQEFPVREDVMKDKEVRATRCYKCGRPARKRLHWFAGRTKIYYCLAQCSTHGYIRGKVRIKKNDEHQFFAVKTIRLIEEEDAEKIYQLKNEVIEKRREKRHEKKHHKQV